MTLPESARRPGAFPAPQRTTGESFGGVDAYASKDHLLTVARRLGIKGRSAMKKKELAAAIQRANDRKTAKPRSK